MTMASLQRRVVTLGMLVCLGLLAADPVAGAEQPLGDLVAATKSDDAQQRLEAIQALGATGNPEAVPVLVRLLQSKSAEERGYAAQALGQLGPAAKVAAKPLIDLLGDPQPGVRRLASEALGAIRPGPKVAVPIFTKLMQDADPGVQLRVMSAIADAGPDAVPAMIETLKNDRAAYWACVILRDIGPPAKPAVPALIAKLKDPQPEIRREAALALAAIGSKEACQPLVPLLKDTYSSTPATFALGALGEIPPEAESIMRANINSDDKMLSTVSLWALARVHPEDKKMLRAAITQLVAELSDEDPFVRAAAARALAELPPSPEIAIPIFKQAMSKADEQTAMYMLDALAALGPKVVPNLINALQFDAMRPQVAYILGEIGPPAAPATESLAKLVGDQDPNVNVEAAHALAKIGPGAKAAVPALVEALGADDENKPTHAAAFALGSIGPDAAAAVPALIEVVKRYDDTRSLIAAWAVVQIEGPAAQPNPAVLAELVSGLDSEYAESRKGAAETLGSLGPHAKSAIPQLKRAAQDADESVRNAAQQALESIAG